MEEKGTVKISLAGFFLILAIVAIIIMGFFIYKLNNDKTDEIVKSTNLQTQVNSLSEQISDLQGKMNYISKITENEKVNNNTTEIINSKKNFKIGKYVRKYSVITNEPGEGIQEDVIKFDENGTFEEADYALGFSGAFKISDDGNTIICTAIAITNEHTSKRFLEGIGSVKFKIVDESTIEVIEANEIKYKYSSDVFEGTATPKLNVGDRYILEK